MSKWEKKVEDSLSDIFADEEEEKKETKDEDFENFSDIADEEIDDVFDESEEEFLKDIDDYYSTNEQINLVSNGVHLTIAKKFMIEKKLNPIRGNEITDVFEKWLRENHPEEIKYLKKEKLKKSDIFATNEDITQTKKLEVKTTKNQKEQKRKKVIKSAPTDYNYFELIIALVWGEDGTSKSEQWMKFEPKEHTLAFDLEDKLRPLAAKLGFPQENIINAKKYNVKFDVSGPDTLDGIRRIIAKIKKCKIDDAGEFKDIKTVVLDGISDLRKPYAVMEWLSEHPERQRPMNWGDWGEINDKVRDICFSLINLGVVTKTNIIFTAQIKYEDDGRVPNCKPWIWHNIQHKFKLTRDDVNYRFYAYCEKSHYDPFWTIDLTDFTHKEKPSLFNILQDPELVEKHINETKKERSELIKKKMEGNIFG